MYKFSLESRTSQPWRNIPEHTTCDYATTDSQFPFIYSDYSNQDLKIVFPKKDVECKFEDSIGRNKHVSEAKHSKMKIICYPRLILYIKDEHTLEQLEPIQDLDEVEVSL